MSGTTNAAGAVAAAGLQHCPQFRYWVDEILWSQGRTATIELEEVLIDSGGVRTGGPHKLLCSSKGIQHGPSAITIAQLQQGLTAVELASAPQSDIAGTQTQSHDAPRSNFAQQPAEHISGRQVQQPHQSPTRSSHSVSIQKRSEGSTPPADGLSAASAVAAAAADAAVTSSELDSSSMLPSSLNRRPDDSLLGYHHIKQWDFLWTKSVYAIKAARQLQPGQLVSAIAGLNCLTMKKRMVQTLRMVSPPTSHALCSAMDAISAAAVPSPACLLSGACNPR